MRTFAIIPQWFWAIIWLTGSSTCLAAFIGHALISIAFVPSCKLYNKLRNAWYLPSTKDSNAVVNFALNLRASFMHIFVWWRCHGCYLNITPSFPWILTQWTFSNYRPLSMHLNYQRVLFFLREVRFAVFLRQGKTFEVL